MKTISLYIDESGTLPDPKDHVIIIAAVRGHSSTALNKLVNSVRLRKTLKKPLSEIKFYTAGKKTKELFYKNLIMEDLDIFVLIVDKMGRKIPDTPENYAVLSLMLLSEVLQFYDGPFHLIFDRHFHRKQDIEAFNAILKRTFSRKTLIFSHVNSIDQKAVNVADMIAGAIFAHETGKDSTFYVMIKNKIISEIRLNWTEAKRRLIENKKLA